MSEIITVDDLNQIYYLRKDLERLKETIKEARTQTISSPSFEFHSQGGEKASSEERYTESTEHYINELINKQTELNSLIKAVEEFINEINDPVMRLIIHYRCVKCLSWEEVAIKLGAGNSAESVRQRYKRFILATF